MSQASFKVDRSTMRIVYINISDIEYSYEIFLEKNGRVLGGLAGISFLIQLQPIKGGIPNDKTYYIFFPMEKHKFPIVYNALMFFDVFLKKKHFSNSFP